MKLITFYLPQFHPIPENDSWWGKGFTEWTTVTKARPRFPGHHQPHLPADLGFYDLRVPEVRQAQAELAREYGIYGFCYYHYWFHGKRLLERPFGEVLASGQPDFPFCLCWANENWTRTWDGLQRHVLIEQKYSTQDDLNHIRALADSFRDSRYIRVNGKPLFLVYRASQLPDPTATTDLWREEAARLGIGDLFLGRVESHAERGDPRPLGFDCGVEFQPRMESFGAPLRRDVKWYYARRLGLMTDAYQENNIYSYVQLVDRALSESLVSYPRIPCVFPSWDNSARRESGATIFAGSSPKVYQEWLAATIRKAKFVDGDDSIIFVNGWNEWAEGNHLEPCRRWGRAYLEATREALSARDELAGAD